MECDMFDMNGEVWVIGNAGQSMEALREWRQVDFFEQSLDCKGAKAARD
jgi:hypothetical protein